MFNAPRTAALVAILTLSGSLALVVGLPGSDDAPIAPGVESRPDLAVPAEFSGHLTYTGSAPGPRSYGYRWDELSDPRLDGEVVLAVTSRGLSGYPGLVWHASFRIVTEEGAWEEVPNLTLEYTDGTASTRTSALIGEGAYEGLTAITELTYIPNNPFSSFDVRGVIVADELPDPPKHASSE